MTTNYITTLQVDEENTVREQARQSLFGVLFPKSNFAICYTNFVESIFVLNEVSSHASVSALTSLSSCLFLPSFPCSSPRIRADKQD